MHASQSAPRYGAAVAHGSFELPYMQQAEQSDPAAQQQLMDLLQSIHGPAQGPIQPPMQGAFNHFASGERFAAPEQPFHAHAEELHAAAAHTPSAIQTDFRGTSTGSTSFSVEGNWDEEFAFTPLVSPAMTPLSALLSPQTQGLKNGTAHVSPAEVFTPLTSPALRPQDAHMQTDQAEADHLLHLTEQASTLGLDGFQLPRAQGLDQALAISTTGRGRGASRTAPKSRPSPIIKPVNRSAKNSAPPTPAMPQSSQMVGDTLHSTPSPIDIDVGMAVADAQPDIMLPPPLPQLSGGMPATPSSLMNMGHEMGRSNGYEPSQDGSASNSPVIGPKRPRKTTSKGSVPKSNRNSVEFAALPPSTVAPEERRNSHRAAEQRRRDSLKLCFEELRPLLPHIPPEEDEEAIAAKRPGEGNVAGQRVSGVDPLHPNKGVSKVALLRKSNAYIQALEKRVRTRDDALQRIKERYGIPDEDLQFNDYEDNWPWNGTPGDEGHSPYSAAAMQAAAIANGTYEYGARRNGTGVVTRNRSKRNSGVVQQTSTIPVQPVDED